MTGYQGCNKLFNSISYVPSCKFPKERSYAWNSYFAIHRAISTCLSLEMTPKEIDSARKALVVGGTGSRIGGRLVERFLAEGRIVIQTICRSASFEQRHPRLFTYRMDVTSEDQVRETVNKVWKKHVRIDDLVYNSGVLDDVPVAVMKSDQWRRVLSVNLDGLFFVCKYASRKMIRDRRGSITVMSSYMGVTGSRYQAKYAASKGGGVSFSKSLALELAPFNIRVNAVCPGFIPSGLNCHSKKKTASAKAKSALGIEDNLEDLTNFIQFIASDRLKAVTGQVFHIDSRI